MYKSLFAIAGFALLSACGDPVSGSVGKGESVSENRTVGNFSRIEISVPMNAEVHVQEGIAPSMQISGYKNVLAEVKTQVFGQTLKIFKDGFLDFDTDREIVAQINVPSLDALQIKGSADATTTGTLKSQDLLLTIDGAGNITVADMAAQKLRVEIAGAGDVSIGKGTATWASYTISGAGKISSFGLLSDDVVAEVNGSGDMEVSAAKSLDANISGAGDIRYKGTPALKTKTSGSGEITAAN